MIGKWCKDHGKPETAQVIALAQIERPPDPVAYIQGIFKKRANNGYGEGHSGVPL
jgi:hypothetical protein